jgi:putative ABC transport system permease protein
LIEAGTIAVIGGAIGVLCGIVVAKLVYLTTSPPAAVQLWSVLGGLLVALSVGLSLWHLSGVESFAVDPVEALRAE